MAQPLDAMLALAQANMRLALKLAETWRESGQTIIEIGGRGASEVAEETRAAISRELKAARSPCQTPAICKTISGSWNR